MGTEHPADAMGAEAVIEVTEYLGHDAVVKRRLAKPYRHPDLDAHLRSSRTRNEAKVMHEARCAGVRTPCIYDIDLRECSITMERLRGETAKSVLDGCPSRADEVCGMIGRAVSKLHSAGICHGDLTTSNIIMCDDGLCLIDFSLGRTHADMEDIGVDIRLLERAFTSAHTDLTGSFSVLLDEYYGGIPDPEAVRRKLEDIRNRGRYT